MAHAIIFVDRAPRTRPDDYTSYHLSYTAGAYKIASVLREMGLTVLVVPHCFNLSFAGVQQIINNNSKDLLWVGISGTFMHYEPATPTTIGQYQKLWMSGTNIIDTEFLLQPLNGYKVGGTNNAIWSIDEISKIGYFLEKKYNVPLLVGGAMLPDKLQNSHNPAHPMQRNVYLVKGNAETYVKHFTEQRLLNPKFDPVFFASNAEYDDTEFKTSQILWDHSDLVNERDWLSIETARGCAFNCAYCSYPRRSRFDSFRDPASLRQELIKNYEKFGVTRYSVVDDLYNDSKEKVRLLFDEVWSKLPFVPELVLNLRLDMIWSDPDSAQILLDSGCKFGQFGIETLHDQAGRKVGKGLGKQRILSTLEHVNRVWGTDSLVGINMIAGLPFEPLESIKESMSWCQTTNLIYSAKWQPLYVKPPTFQKLVNASSVSQLDNDNEKYQITWIGPNEWINSAGVKFSEVADLCLNIPETAATRSNYIDFRTMGFTHQQLANIQTTPLDQAEVDAKEQWVRQEVASRLNTVLSLKI